jgi:hypothetical protein
MTTEQTLMELGVREFDPNETLYVLTRTTYPNWSYRGWLC